MTEAFAAECKGEWCEPDEHRAYERRRDSEAAGSEGLVEPGGRIP